MAEGGLPAGRGVGDRCLVLAASLAGMIGHSWRVCARGAAGAMALRFWGVGDASRPDLKAVSGSREADMWLDRGQGVEPGSLAEVESGSKMVVPIRGGQGVGTLAGEMWGVTGRGVHCLVGMALGGGVWGGVAQEVAYSVLGLVQRAEILHGYLVLEEEKEEEEEEEEEAWQVAALVLGGTVGAGLGAGDRLLLAVRPVEMNGLSWRVCGRGAAEG